MKNEAEAFRNPEIEEAGPATDDDQEAVAFGRLELKDVVDDNVEAVEEDDDDDNVEAVGDLDDVGAAEDLDDLEAHLNNRLHHIVVVDLNLYNPDEAAIGRIDALFRDTIAELEANATDVRAARADLEDASRSASAANAAPVLPGIEQAAARARARQALQEARLDVEDLVAHRWALVQIVLWLVLVRAVAVALSRTRLAPAVLLAFVAAEFIVAYASRGAYVVGGTSTVTRVAILTMLWVFGY